MSKNVIRKSWFAHPYCGVALGYAKDHMTSDSYVRCLLCQRDVKVLSRGITTFMEHCRGVRHHRLDCLYRLRRSLPLRTRFGELMSEEESAVMRSSLEGVDVRFESCPTVPIDHVLSAEMEGVEDWRDAVDGALKDRCERLLVCLLLDCLQRDGNLESVMSLWSTMVLSDDRNSSLCGPSLSAANLAVSC